MDRGRWKGDGANERNWHYGPPPGSRLPVDGHYGPAGPDRRAPVGGGPPGAWRDGGRGRDDYGPVARAERDARPRSRSRSRSPRSRAHERGQFDREGDRDRRDRERYRESDPARHDWDRDGRHHDSSWNGRDYGRDDGGRRAGRATSDRRPAADDDRDGHGRDRRPSGHAENGRSSAAAGAASAVEDDDEDQAEEDEEAAAARLLEESKKRREAILAKHRAAKEAVHAAQAVVAPTATEIAAGGSSLSAPAVQAAVSASAMPVSGSAAAPPAAATAAPPAAAASAPPTTAAPTAPLASSSSSSAMAVPSRPVGRSMFDDGDDDDDDAYFAALSGTGAGAGAGGAVRGAGRDGAAALLAGRRDDGDGYGEGGAGAGAAAAAAGGSSDQSLSLSDNWDDHDGYYRLRVGETIGPGGRYRVLGLRGRGVFSSVLYCKDAHAGDALSAAAAAAAAGGLPAGTEDDDEAAAREAAAGTIATAAAPLTVSSSGAVVRGHAALATGSTEYVAVKLIRSNDTMRRAGQRELELLRTIATADPTGRYHCVRLLHTFEHRGHLCLAFEPLNMNLKEVQNKFGKGVGISIGAVRSYARQMLLSLSLLAKLRIVHADIKPHNILANERYNVIKLADFGSGFKEDDPDNLPTPLLVSRFYRAPEIILGYPHTPALDMWSVACCLYELYTGSPLFPGVDNNDMLWLHQSLKGRFPLRMLRFHLRQVEAYGFEAHFAPDLRFKRALQDPVSRAPITKVVDITTPSTDLGAALLAKRAADDDKRAVLALRDLLEAMLALDPAKRISVRDAMNHPFIRGSASASASATASSGHGHGHGHGHGYGHRDGGGGSGR